MAKKKPDWKRDIVRYSDKDKANVCLSLEFDIDWEAIARAMAYRADKSKSGRASMMHGAIKAKVAKREVLR